MSSTLRDRVLTFLSANYDQTFTNKEIAERIGAPEPSVRRATKALNLDAQIITTDFSLPFRVQAVPVVPPSSL